MGKKIDYPVQMASIKKGDYRLSEHLGKSRIELIKIENDLWRKIKGMVDDAPKPLKTSKYFPGCKLLGYGWEFAVYTFPKDDDLVVKVPRGIFPEVSKKEYLENVKYSYRVLKKHLGKYILKSDFKREQIKGENINVIYQKRISSEQYRKIKIDKINEKHRVQFMDLSKAFLKVLEEHDWIPKIGLKKEDGKTWKVWDFAVDENNDIRVFDFSDAYDVFRLYPERTKQEIINKTEKLEGFISDLKK